MDGLGLLCVVKLVRGVETGDHVARPEDCKDQGQTDQEAHPEGGADQRVTVPVVTKAGKVWTFEISYATQLLGSGSSYMVQAVKIILPRFPKSTNA